MPHSDMAAKEAIITEKIGSKNETFVPSSRFKLMTLRLEKGVQSLFRHEWRYSLASVIYSEEWVLASFQFACGNGHNSKTSIQFFSFLPYKNSVIGEGS